MPGEKSPGLCLGLGLRLEPRWGNEARERLRSYRVLPICGCEESTHLRCALELQPFFATEPRVILTVSRAGHHIVSASSRVHDCVCSLGTLEEQ